jgi:nucleotide-binding universal stress UspA family protein
VKVLLPVDVTHPINPTLNQLEHLLNLADAKVDLLYVKEELPSYEVLVETTGNFQEDYGRKVEAAAGKVLDEVKQALNGKCKEVTSKIVSGPAAMMIETVAQDGAYDVVVVTPGQHSKLDAFLMGSTSKAIVEHCPGTIIICRPTSPPQGEIKKVVLGVDGSEQSRHALLEAISLLRLPKETEINLIHVVSVAEILKMVSPVEYISFVENNLLLEGETFLANSKELLSTKGYKNVNCSLKEGDPASEILALAKKLPADLIVTGAKGRTAVEHFLLGSVSNRVAMHASCATAVVKPEKK